MIKKLLLTPLILTAFNLTAVEFFKDGIAYELQYGTGSYLDVVAKPDGSKYTGNITIPSYPDVQNSGTSKGPWPVCVIQGDAFAGCGELTSITLPETLTGIWTAYQYPDHDATFEWGAFGGCRKLTAITIPAKVSRIEPYTFADCTSLKTLSIPASVRYSNYESLAPWCTSMTSITVDSKNQDLYAKDGILYYFESEDANYHHRDEYCLITCPAGKTSATIAANTTLIGTHAFAGCSKITKVSIPGSCTAVGSCAFEGCTRLTSVECIAIEPPAVGNDTFEAATLKGTLTVPECALDAYKAHEVWGKFKTIKGVATTFTSNGIVYDILDHSYKFAYVAYNKSKTGKVTIPATVTNNGMEYSVVYIAEQAFSPSVSTANEQVTSVSIPASMLSIENTAFYDCQSLTSISVDAGNQYFSAKDGILYDKDKANLLVCPRGKTGSVTIPSGVATVTARSFEGCAGITSVSFPSSVETIGENAFTDCLGLTDVNLGNGLKEVGENALRNCGLTELTLPASVETVNYYSFNMPSLRNVTSLRLGAPFSYADLVFSPETYEGGILFVEPGYEKGYSTARGFSNFNRILAIGTSGITSADTEAVAVASLNGGIIIKGAPAGIPVKVLSADGSLIRVDNTDAKPTVISRLRPGLYIVAVGATTAKIILN